MRTNRFPVACTAAGAALGLLVLADSARAHDDHHPQCYSEAPPPNSEGPPEEEGFWEPVVDIGITAIHAIHLPNSGELLLWGYNHGQKTSAPGLVYDPETDARQTISVGTAAFCAGHSHLADGRVFISGGQGGGGLGTIFDPVTETFSVPVPLYGTRFYPTHTVLSDGRVFISGGTGARSNIPEIFDPETNTTEPLGCLLLPTGKYKCGKETRMKLHYYPRAVLGEDDNILMLPASRPFLAHTFDYAQSVWVSHEHPDDSKGRWRPAPAVYYAENRVLRAGSDTYASSSSAVGVTTVVETDDVFAPVERTTAPMAYARNRTTLTLLADGKVLATGGKRDVPCAAGDPHVYHPELWDPATETWETLGPMQEKRVYHSVAILLRDGSVFSAGGEARQTTSQIFRPPYLFLGPRPTITSAPAQLEYDTTFDVFSPEATSVQAVNLVRLGAVTHAYDQSQRFVPLEFTAEPGRLIVESPWEPYDAPPGYYMLFLISDQGVPSVAEYVQMLPTWW
jgi:hypothetical protein